MLTLEKFEQLAKNPLAKRQGSSSLFANEQNWTAWRTRLPHLDKHEQYRQLKTVISELIVADLPAGVRFWHLEQTCQPLERLITQMQHGYIHNPQSACDEQKLCIAEVRSLYFLSILAYQAIVFDVMGALDRPKNKRFGVRTTTGNLVLNGVSFGTNSEPKRLYTLSVFRVMNLCYKLSMEFALTYQKFPKSFWRLLNGWYLKSALLQVDKLCISQLSDQPANSIYQQYLQSCLASFTNVFAYRRADILQVFRILPKWVGHIKTTFTADSDLRLFVNLKADTPPELISPYASINPYKDEHVCLFFDAKALFAYLTELKQSTDDRVGFERRLAGIVLLAFHHQADPEANKGAYSQSATMLVGFGAIYKQLSEGKSFNQIIAQSALKKSHHPKRLFGTHDNHEQEQVRLIRRSDAGAQFIVGEYAQTAEGENQILTRPYLPVFSLFAMKSPRSTHQFPWRLGIVYWAQGKEEHVEVDGRFLGRILSVCGIRLNTRDARSQAFVQAFLIAGDELNQQTTLVLPRYHFKAGDVVVLRVQTKETTLRLEQNLLTTDEIEQYLIVRI